MKDIYWWFLGGIAVGIIAAPQIRKIPGVNKLPVI
jgi:hypothetical protein